jgi:hypothetical protein
MRSRVQFTLAFLGFGVVSGCAPETAVDSPVIPAAGVRFINAVPDYDFVAGTDTTLRYGMDFRFVDFLENNVQFRIAYRNTLATTGAAPRQIPASTQVQFKEAQGGNRQFRIFLNDPNGSQPINSTVVNEGTQQVDAGTNYTFLLWGYKNPTGPGRPAAATAMKLTIIPETVANPGTQVALRVINTTVDALDVRAYAWNSTVATPVATWLNVPAMSVTTYTNVAPDTLSFNVRLAGAAAGSYFGAPFAAADPRALVGCPGSDGKDGTFLPCQGFVGPIDPLAGTTMAGSAVTLIVYPPTVNATAAPQTTGTPSYKTAQPGFVWDRRPPRLPGT